MNRSRGFRLLLALLLAGVWFFATAQDDPVVIRLGDKTETLSTFNQNFEIAMRGVASQQGAELDDALREQLSVYKPQFLEQRATELALLAEAERRSLSVGEEEVEQEVEALRGSLSEDQTFEDFLAEAGFADEAAFRSYLSENLLVQKLVAALREEATPSDEEVQAAFEARAEMFTRPEQVCARHILVDTEEAAQALLEDLNGGADFAELAETESTDPGSGANGGDLGCFEQASMVEPFGEAAFNAELDTPVGPVQTEFGYHIIEVYDRQEAGQLPLEEVRPQLEAELAQEKFGAEIERLRDASGVEVFPEAAGLSSETPQPDGGEDSETGGSAQDGETGGSSDGQ